MELNRLFIKVIGYPHEESSCKNKKVESNSLGLIGEGKRSWTVHFHAFRETKIQNWAFINLPF